MESCVLLSRTPEKENLMERTGTFVNGICFEIITGVRPDYAHFRVQMTRPLKGGFGREILYSPASIRLSAGYPTNEQFTDLLLMGVGQLLLGRGHLI